MMIDNTASISGKLVHGFGINDVPNMAKTKIYQTWVDMIKRSKSEKFKQKRPSYIGVDCSSDWRYLSNFIEDTKNMVGFCQDGWELDKDILIKGNKIYSKNTCCFVPCEINNLFVKCSAKRGDYPIGVYLHNSGKFVAYAGIDGRQVKKGMFDTPEDAFLKHKEMKEAEIKRKAIKFKDSLDPRVFEALINYEVLIND